MGGHQSSAKNEGHKKDICLVVLKLVRLFNPRPQNRILVSLRGSFQNFP